MNPPTSSRGAGLLTLAVVVWAGVLTAGFAAVAAYAGRPGEPVEPAALATPPSGDKPWTLLVAVHPKCPCTQATVNELARLMRHVEPSVECRVLAYTPDPADPTWMQTSLVESAASIPGVSVTPDPQGRRAAAVGVTVSGGVVLYDQQGDPRFSGGITASRGHEGDCAGGKAVRDLVAGRPAPSSTPVFGCSLVTRTGASHDD